MPDRALLMPIKPKYAEMLFEGVKSVELRRIRPRVDQGDIVLLYVSSPTKAVVGAFEVENVIERPVEDLWPLVEGAAGLSRTEFDVYFNGASRGVAIFLSRIVRFYRPVFLTELQAHWPGFRPPQSYQYLETPQLEIACISRGLSRLVSQTSSEPASAKSRQE